MTTFTDLVWTKKVKPSQKLLLLALARRSESTNGVCAITAPELAAEMCVSLMTVWKSVRELEAAGLLMVERNDHAAPNVYGLRMGDF